MKKRLLALLLVICMVLGMLPMTAFAAETNSADLTTLNGGTANNAYGTYTTASGWTLKNGQAYNVNNVLSAILNGKTSAVGSLTSPTLTGGIQDLTITYTNPYSESNGVDITITVTGATTATYNLNDDSVTKLAEETVTWTLDTAIEGEFTIVITNNSPSSSSSSNKDRVAITALSWTGYTTGTECAHEPVEGSGVVTPATCTANGYTTYTCALCGESYKADEVVSEGHQWDAGVVTAPSCTYSGYTLYTCTVENCGATNKTDYVDATGHDIVVEGTTVTCENCDLSGEIITIPEANEIATAAGTTATTEKYIVTGVVTSVKNTTFGNLYIEDEEGNELYIYGVYDADGDRYSYMDYKPVAGDTVILQGALVHYNSTTIEMTNATLLSYTEHGECDYTYSEVVTAPTCTAAGYTTGTCICGATSTYNETEMLAHSYDHGVCTVCGGEDSTYVAVAQIGDVKYDSLAEAVAAGGEVKLLTDVALTESIKVTGDVIVDLNGNKLTGPDDGKANWYAFIVDGGNLTLKDSVGTGELWAKCYGVETKSGTFTMESGKITATNNATVGSAVVNYGGTVTINGGTLSGALSSVCTGGHFAVAETVINGGELTGPVTISDYNAKGSTIKSAANTYATVEGYEWVEEDGLYVLSEIDYVAEVGGVKYESLAEAVAAAEDGAVVTLLGDATGAGIVIDKNITIDFGGYTYTVNSAVGSTGTETLAFQIKAGSNATPYDVTLKNGTIAVTNDVVEGSNPLKVVIMNYSNLTLEDITIDGTGSSAMECALANNNGETVLTGNTNIKVAEGVTAIDVDGTQEYYGAVNVTVNTTGTIEGRLDFYGEEAAVSLENGTFTGAVYTYGYDDADIQITGGSYTDESVKAYVPYWENITFNGEEWTNTPELPNAQVENLGSINVAVEDYYIYDLIGGTGLSTGTAPFDMTVAMEFIALDDAEAAAANGYAEWTTDFFIEITGMANGSFVGDGCYLAGYYPSYGEWVVIPLDNFTIENGKIYPVISSAGFDFSYVDICTSVEDFICGIYFTDEVLAANPDMQVKLTLGLSEDLATAQSATFTEVDSYTYEGAELSAIDAVATIEGELYNTLYASLAEAVEAAAEGDTITLLQSIVIDEDTTLDLTGKTLDGNGYVPAIRITNGATVTVEGGNFVNADSYIFILGASDASSEGNLVINGGTFHAQTTVASVTKGALTVNGGEFSVTPYYESYAYLLNCIDTNYKNGTATITVNHGTFHNWNPADNAAEGANTNFAAEGTMAVEADGVYTLHALEYQDNYDFDTTHKVTCSVCGIVIAEEEAHNWVDSVCACGNNEPGSVNNPITLYPQDFDAEGNYTATVAAGKTVYYTVATQATGALISLDGTAVGTVAFFPPIQIVVTEGTHVINMSWPVGHANNPDTLVLGENSNAANGDYYHYAWTAIADGELTITLTSGTWAYNILNKTTNAGTDTHWSDDSTVVATETITVAKGDEIVVAVSDYYSGADVAFTAAFVCAEHTEEYQDNYDFGVSHKVTCSVCGTVIAEEAPHEYDENSQCACGVYEPGSMYNALPLYPNDFDADGNYAVNVEKTTYYVVNNASGAQIAVDGTVVATCGWFGGNFSVEAGEHVVTLIWPVGHANNPDTLVLGENGNAANGDYYHYAWTAIADGELTITLTSGTWAYNILNKTTNAGTDTHWSDDSTVVATETITVAKGDEIVVAVSDYYSGADVAFTAAFVCAAHTNGYTDNGDGTHDNVCSVCGTVIADNETHTYVDGVCACGAEEPVVDTGLSGSVDIAAGKKIEPAATWTAPADGYVTITLTTSAAATGGNSYEIWANGVRTDEATGYIGFTDTVTKVYPVVAGDEYVLNLWAWNFTTFKNNAATIDYSFTFSTEAGEVEEPKEPYIISDLVITKEDTHDVAMIENAEMTVVTVTPSEIGYYNIAVVGDAQIANVGAGSYYIYAWENVTPGTSFDWTCKEVAGQLIDVTSDGVNVYSQGQSVMVGIVGDVENVQIVLTKTADYQAPVITEVTYENKATLSQFTLPEGATLGEYVDVYGDTTLTAVLGDDGYYHLNSADGPILLVDMNYMNIVLSDALNSERPIMVVVKENEDGSKTKYDIGAAVQEYEAVMDADGYYPLTEDLIFFYNDYAVSAGTYAFYVTGDYNEENVWMYCMRTMTLPEPECEHAATEYVINDNGTHDKVCTSCGEVIIDDEAHSYGEGTSCVCGNELKGFAGITTALENSLAVNFIFNMSGLEGDGYYAVIEKAKYDGTIEKTITVPQSEWGTHSAGSRITYPGVNSTQMTENITITIYNKDGVQVSVNYTRNMREYLMGQIEKSSVAAVKKTMYVDLLNYGAAAQKYFGYNTAEENLANYLLTEEQKALGTPDNVTIEGELSKGYGYLGATAVLESEITLNFVYDKDLIAEAVSAKITYKNYQGVEQVVSAEIVDRPGYVGTHKMVAVTGMSVPDCGYLMTVELLDAEGKTISTTVDSVAAYCARQIAKGDTRELYPALIKLAYSADIAF